MDRFNNMFEQVLILGILVLLGGSRNLQTAVYSAASLIIISLILRGFSSLLNRDKLAGAHWVLFLALGISLSYSAYLISAVLYPEIYQYSGMYILLIGVTPLTYYGCKTEVSMGGLWKRLNIFFITIVLVSFFRELLGFGSVLGRSFFEVGFAPLGSFEGTPGAFIILGTLWLLVRKLLSVNIISDTIFELEEGAQSE